MKEELYSVFLIEEDEVKERKARKEGNQYGI